MFFDGAFGEIVIWNVPDAVFVREIRGHWRVDCISASPWGDFLASGGLGAHLAFWDAVSFEKVAMPSVLCESPWDDQSVSALRFSPTGDALAVAQHSE